MCGSPNESRMSGKLIKQKNRNIGDLSSTQHRPFGSTSRVYYQHGKGPNTIYSRTAIRKLESAADKKYRNPDVQKSAVSEQDNRIITTAASIYNLTGSICSPVSSPTETRPASPNSNFGTSELTKGLGQKFRNLIKMKPSEYSSFLD